MEVWYGDLFMQKCTRHSKGDQINSEYKTIITIVIIRVTQQEKHY